MKNKNKISNIKETLYFLTNEENVEDNTYDPEWYSNKEGIKNIGFEGEYFGTVSNGEPQGMKYAYSIMTNERKKRTTESVQ